MQIPYEIQELVKQAMQYTQKGKTKEALDCVDRVEKWVEQMQKRKMLTHQEVLYVLAPIGTIRYANKDYSGAAKCKEIVCNIAVQVSPLSTETLGDLCQLAETYKAAGRSTDAVKTFERARELASKIAPEYLKRLDDEIATLKKL